MAFFKFRTADAAASAARQPESIEAMRRRARHRLIGATVLVLVGVVGFPVLFDTQPRPIPVDIPIDIPDRAKAKPLVVPARPAAPAPVASGKVGAAPAAAVAAAPAAAPAPAPVTVQPPKVEAAAPKSEPVAKTEAAPKPEPKQEAAPAAKAQASDEGSKAKAALEGKAAAAAASAEGRFVVQVGAFADNAKAREARLRVERAGLKTYTQVTETKDGRRIRVRVGPFATRADADKAARKIKGLELPAAILTLS